MEGRARLLDVHRAWLERFRRTMNLVGPGPIDVHYADADAGLSDLRPTGRWVDLGTGAGFPGVVLAARWPAVDVDLVDARAKRCAFLDEVLGRAEVDAGVRVLCLRAESLPDATYDGVVSRAFAPPEDALGHAARLLKPGGLAVLFLQADTPVPEVAGFEVLRETPYVVDGKARRTVTLRWRPA